MAGVCLAPLPLRTRAEGVLWLPEQAQVRAGADGFVRRLLASPDQTVRAGDPLLETADPFLAAELAVLEARLRELRARHQATRREDLVEAQIVEDDIATTRAEIARARQRADEAIVRSAAAGRFIVPGAQDLTDRFVRQGEVLAYVAEPAELRARVVVRQGDVDLVRAQTRAVEVRLAGRPGESLPAAIEREVPGASERLPSPALGSEGGGSLAVDPSDEERTRALESVFQFELRLPAELAEAHFGSRVHVRFDHGTETLAGQSYRKLRQLLLSRFGV